MKLPRIFKKARFGMPATIRPSLVIELNHKAGTIENDMAGSYMVGLSMPRFVWVEWQGGAAHTTIFHDRDEYLPFFTQGTGFLPDDLTAKEPGMYYMSTQFYSKGGQFFVRTHATVSPEGMTAHFTEEQASSTLVRDIAKMPLGAFALIHQRIKQEEARRDNTPVPEGPDAKNPGLRMISGRVGDTFRYVPIESLVSAAERPAEWPYDAGTGAGGWKVRDHTVRAFWRQPRRKACTDPDGHKWFTNEEYTEQICAHCGHRRVRVRGHRRGDTTLGTSVRILH